MKKVGIALVILASQAHSDIWEDRAKEHLKSQGFNPDRGVVIVPSSEIKAPKKLKSQWLVQQKKQAQNGYNNEAAPRATELLEMHNTIAYKYKASASNSNPASSLLRRSIHEIKMAYTFMPVPKTQIKTLLGFAASGGYQDGWNGIVEFFDTKSESCAYTENNLKLSHGTEKIDENIVRYDVNGKVTTVNVQGTKESGFLYTVHWIDDHFSRDLECASKQFSKDTTMNVLALASRIDAQ
ncbi:MAG: hypothetical protein H0U73_04310 [Tatlockia sp.]|nr:hypothetical protein [Tatlockia sp.]